MARQLEEYREKRDFGSTPEPQDGKGRGGERFVIQKHDASSLHYDLRFESDGVLKSWAVPKGPSTDPSEKRLAVPTEDHPIDYLDFEGVIPEDEYGAGTVIVWDTGTYQNESTNDSGKTLDLTEGIDRGHVSVVLQGEKIRGGYSLVRTGSSDDDRWLFVKKDDDQADARRNPTSTEPNSVLTDRTLEEVEGEGTSE